MKRVMIACAMAFLGAAPAVADEKADALIEKARQVALAAKSLEGSAEMTSTFGPGTPAMAMKATVQLLKPNYGRMRMTGTPTGDLNFVSDGKTMHIVIESQKQYMTMPSPEKGISPGGAGEPNDPIMSFLSPERIGAQGKRFYAGAKTIDGKQYETVKLVYPDHEELLYFGENGLLVRTDTSRKLPNGPTMSATSWLKEAKLDTELTPAQFAYTPPPDLKPFDPTAGRQGGTDSADSMDKSLVAVGKKAPDFTIPTPQGATVNLQKTAAVKKATVVNFWFYG